MASFDADDALQALDVRGLSRYGIEDFTIPEPTNRQVRAFRRFMQRAFDGVKSGDIAKRYAKAISNAKGDEDKADAACATLDAELYEITSATCSGVLTADQLEALPNRVFREFYRWLAGELLDPTVSSPATRPSLTVVRGEQSAS